MCKSSKPDLSACNPTRSRRDRGSTDLHIVAQLLFVFQRRGGGFDVLRPGEIVAVLYLPRPVCDIVVERDIQGRHHTRQDLLVSYLVLGYEDAATHEAATQKPPGAETPDEWVVNTQ